MLGVFKSKGILWPEGVSLDRFSKIHWPDGAWFLCNPIDGLTHFNPRMCKDSQRSEEAVTPCRYTVLERDHKPKEQWFPTWLTNRQPALTLEARGGRARPGGKSAYAEHNLFRPRSGVVEPATVAIPSTRPPHYAGSASPTARILRDCYAHL